MYYPSQSKLNFAAISKALSFIFLALLITFLLFVLMHKLTKLDDAQFTSPVTTVMIDPLFHKQNDTTIIKEPIRSRPEPKERPQVPDKELLVDPTATLLVSTDDFSLLKPSVDNEFTTVLGTGEGEARPIVRVEPKYPIEAARDGIEGWVRLSFTIASSGQVVDIEVVDAEPKRTFDREAKRALAKWKYQPQVIDGNPIAQENMMVVLDFKLSEG
jgi:periplasmic protein TonB